MVYIFLMLLTAPLAYLWQKMSSCEYVEVSCGVIKARIYRGRIFAIAAFLPLYLVYATQYSVHSDYDNYQIMYSLALAGKQSVRDPAFLLLFRTLAKLELPFQCVYYVTYFFAFLLLAICIRDYSTDYSMSLVLFISAFFMLGFYYIRQLMAVAIVFYAYRYTQGHNFLKYLILVLMASLFHTSALVMIPGYVLLHYRQNLSFYVVIAFACAVLNAIKSTVLTWLVARFIPQYFGRHEMFRSFGFDLYDTIWILQLVFLAAVYAGSVYKGLENPLETVFFRGLITYFILYFLGRWILEFERFGYYFYFPVICLYPRFLEEISKIVNRQSLLTVLKLSTYILVIMLFFLKYSTDTVWNYNTIITYM